jgi:hypothetical protein
MESQGFIRVSDSEASNTAESSSFAASLLGKVHFSYGAR